MRWLTLFASHDLIRVWSAAKTSDVNGALRAIGKKSWRAVEWVGGQALEKRRGDRPGVGALLIVQRHGKRFGYCDAHTPVAAGRSDVVF
jgi:hypothetical protein